MAQSSEWRDKAASYWNMSKTMTEYHLCEHYAELAAQCLDMAEELERGDDNRDGEYLLERAGRQDEGRHRPLNRGRGLRKPTAGIASMRRSQ
jgi:hypothetical protein